jgi:hypothetical protein
MVPVLQWSAMQPFVTAWLAFFAYAAVYKFLCVLYIYELS